MRGRKGRRAAQDTGQKLHCSVCNQSQDHVRTLIAGPSARMCDECVDLCVEIIAGDAPMPAPLDAQADEDRVGTPRWVATARCTLCRMPGCACLCRLVRSGP